MSANAEEIKQQLRLTQQALENEVLRNPKPSLVDRSVLDLNPDKVVPPDLYVESAFLKATVGYDDEDVCDSGLTTRGRRRPPWPHSSPPESGTELVAEALARIRDLEKEAEMLEEAYRSYHQNAVRVPVSHTPPERTSAAYVRPTTAAQHRVTFDLNGLALGPVFMGRELTHRESINIPLPSDRVPPRAHSPTPRRLSSTPVSAKTRPRTHTDQEVSVDAPGSDRSAVTFTGLSPDRDVSPILSAAAVSSNEYTNITPPSSPQMKSTTRNHCSPPKLQEIIPTSSQESSPKPEKISIQDLTEPVTVLSADLQCSLERLQDERIFSPTASHQKTDSPPQSHLSGNCLSPSNLAAVGEREEERRWMEREEEENNRRLKEREKEEDERRLREEKEERRLKKRDDDQEREKTWKEEEEYRRRRQREEGQEREWRLKEEEERRRQREREEDQERERRELEKELLEQAISEGGGIEKEEEGDVMEENEGSVSSAQSENLNPNTTNPLHKYMMMVMQSREREQKEKSPGSDEPDHQSHEAVVLSDNKDDSIAAFSHDDAEDDFW
ncbi:hypothetical protein NFI96_026051 [Prochilodus magdalenae]|nr:hypothetical protein NFI96_026051 [Prochilodus magdalenae]